MSVDSEPAPIHPIISKLGFYTSAAFPIVVFTDVMLDPYTSPSFLCLSFYPRIWLNPASYWSVVAQPLLLTLTHVQYLSAGLEGGNQGCREDTGNSRLEFKSTTLILEGDQTCQTPKISSLLTRLGCAEKSNVLLNVIVLFMKKRTLKNVHRKKKKKSFLKLLIEEGVLYILISLAVTSDRKEVYS